jgi:D-proline reductase (dithiol) PrdB
MPRLEDLPEITRQSYLTFPVFEHEDTPFTRPRKPLDQSRVGLVTTAGLHVRGDRPFFSGDQTYRVIPTATPTSQIVQSHSSIGFDRTAFMRDVNISYPIDRLQELAQRGEIGSVAANGYSFMGAARTPRTMERETGPEVARRLLADGVDVVLLTPT